MRRRLITGFIGLAILLVGVYGVPRVYIVAHLVQREEQHRVDDTAALIARVLDQRTTPVTASTLDALNGDYEWIQVRRDGSLVATTGTPIGTTAGDLTATRALAGGGTVTVGLSASVVSSAVSNAIVPLILLGVGIIVVAGLAIYLVAPRLARPFQQLANAARGLGRGDLRPDLPRYRVPELRAVAEAMTASGAKIETMLAHERKLSVHASHELRTPITALRLELEDLALWPETAPSVAAQLQRATGELDRLSAAVGDLLLLSRERRRRAETDVDLDRLVADVISTLGGTVHQVRNGPVPIRLDATQVSRIVQKLIEDQSKRGAERVTISMLDLETHVEVNFRVDGARMSRPQASEPTSELAASLGGQITRNGRTLTLRLPRHARRAGD